MSPELAQPDTLYSSRVDAASDNLMETLIDAGVRDPSVSLDFDRSMIVATWDDGGSLVEQEAAIVAAARTWGAARAEQQSALHAWQQERLDGNTGNTDAYKAMNATWAAAADALDALAAALGDTEEKPDE